MKTIAVSLFVYFFLLPLSPLVKNMVESPSDTVLTTEKPQEKADGKYYIVISKKNYELKVYDEQGWYATYPCVFGSNDLRDKYMEGDKRTPEGEFKVVLKKNNGKWAYQLTLDYPNEENIVRFNQRKAKGLIPKNARIGGGIAIHGTRPQEEWTVDHFQNWTDGCISLKYSEAKDLYSYIPVGTKVTIVP